MRFTHAALATTLLFPLVLFAQHTTTTTTTSTPSAGSGGGSHSSPPSSSPSSHVSTPSGASSHTSASPHASGGSAPKGSSPASHPSNTGASRTSSDGKSKSNVVQNKDENIQAKPGTSPSDKKDTIAKEHAKRSWLPWRRHSDQLAQKDKDKKVKDEDKKKCKPGKPCKGEEKQAQNIDDIKPVCKHGKPCVCPTGFSLENGRCVSTPQTAYNCLPGSPNTRQSAGQPCNSTQNNCSLLAEQIQREELELARLRDARQAACYQGPSSQDCAALTTQYEQEALQLERLRREYEACLHR